jgi:hypothetical protein
MHILLLHQYDRIDLQKLHSSTAMEPQSASLKGPE